MSNGEKMDKGKLGEILIQARKSAGMTQTELGALAQVSSRTVYRAEQSGEVSRRSLIKIALVLSGSNREFINQTLELAGEAVLREGDKLPKINLVPANVEVVIPPNHLLAMSKMPKPTIAMLGFLQTVERAGKFALTEELCTLLLQERERQLIGGT